MCLCVAVIHICIIRNSPALGFKYPNLSPYPHKVWLSGKLLALTQSAPSPFFNILKWYSPDLAENCSPDTPHLSFKSDLRLMYNLHPDTVSAGVIYSRFWLDLQICIWTSERGRFIRYKKYRCAFYRGFTVYTQSASMGFIHLVNLAFTLLEHFRCHHRGGSFVPEVPLLWCCLIFDEAHTQLVDGKIQLNLLTVLSCGLRTTTWSAYAKLKHVSLKLLPR